METNFCLNPYALWNNELSSFCKEMKKAITNIYSGNEIIHCSYTQNDNLTWITLGVGNKKGSDLRKRVLINLPYLDEFQRDSFATPSLEMSFDFLNSRDTPFFEELSKRQVYRTAILFDEGFINQIVKFLLSRNMIDTSYFKKFVEEN